MKRLIIASILTIAMNTAFAQFDWGVKVGGGTANIGGGTNTGYDASFGAFARVELLDRFGIQFDALYSIKGASRELSDSASGKKSFVTYDFRYVEIPLQVYVPFTKHLHLLVGLNLASVSSAKYIHEDDDKWTDIKGAEAKMGNSKRASRKFFIFC